jgi:hypothetical protein
MKLTAIVVALSALTACTHTRTVKTVPPPSPAPLSVWDRQVRNAVDGETALNAWLSEFAAADTAYLMHYYQTGEKLPVRGFWQEGTPLLEPLAQRGDRVGEPGGAHRAARSPEISTP